MRRSLCDAASHGGAPLPESLFQKKTLWQLWNVVARATRMWRTHSVLCPLSSVCRLLGHISWPYRECVHVRISPRTSYVHACVLLPRHKL